MQRFIQLFFFLLLLCHGNAFAQKGWQAGMGFGRMFLLPGLNQKGLTEKEWLFTLPQSLGGQDIFRVTGKDPWLLDFELSYAFSRHWAIQSGFQYRSRRFLFVSADYDAKNPVLRSPGSVYTNNVPFRKDLQMWSIPVMARYSFALPRSSRWRYSFLGGIALDQYEMNRRIRDKNINYTSSTDDESFRTDGTFKVITDYATSPPYYMSLRYGISVDYQFRKGNRIKMECSVSDNRLLNDFIPNYLDITMRDILTAGENRSSHDISTYYKFSLYQSGINMSLKYFFQPFRGCLKIFIKSWITESEFSLLSYSFCRPISEYWLTES